ncbi:FIST signal transduction protein [Desulfurivibrio alkaliphilus]|uniref:Histidine kinase n=1 Tax=Desulfurivibrio alkaliphilus (strain DSM 19089 / UNIQEM U267 / AHT2) TaxID=589865 RepID=D6Z1L2_DESAT|nr:FIST N-terminal domain-containing protein [Desulfurivibrio alkaliphilus]ADH85437.1 domain of unknown function DUF1745 [Desulfurivibrio alkaliphilus AHT 2]
MTTRTGVGTSIHRNPSEAGREAVQAAMAQAGIDRCDFMMMFATVGYPQEKLVAAVREAGGRAPLIGCSAEGIIVHEQAIEESHALAVMVWQSDELRFIHAMTQGLRDDPYAAGCDTAAKLGAIPADAAALFLFTDGIHVNFDRFRNGFEDTARPERFLPIFGGAAADNWQLTRTYQYCDDQVFSDGVAGAVLCGPAEIVSGISHGCVPIGRERMITRCEGNKVYEIDGKPALEIFKEYLGTDDEENLDQARVHLCFSFRTPDAMADDYEGYIVRFTPAKDESDGSVLLPTELDATSGIPVWMTRRDFQKMYSGAETLNLEIKRQLAGRRPCLVAHFDCAGRGRMMFREEEKNRLISRLQMGIDHDVPWLGFYTYGEIGPIRQSNFFHNYSAVVACIVT